MKKTIIGLLLAFPCTFAGIGWAETPAPMPGSRDDTRAVAPAAEKAPVTDTHRKTAGELYHLLAPRETMLAAFASMFDPFLEEMSGKIPAEKVLKIKRAARAFGEKIVDDPSLEGRMISIYTETFTEPELHEILRFYRSPAGKKALDQLPELMQKGAQIGQELAQKHLDAFQNEILSILAEGESDTPREETPGEQDEKIPVEPE
ncbi:MAG: DUF2059 domain-containing protein [Deltaproteobacteria bacterium]|nr:MAG: DUF2059 domain-containing protein [Deltaproteobacteria bacterium]